MKSIRKFPVLILALMLILECFAAPALATVSEEPVAIDEQNIVIEDPIVVEEHSIVNEVMKANVSSEETSVPEAEDATIVDSGTCGENLSWELDSTGVLTISGKGEMKNYSETSSAPWTNKSINHVVLSPALPRSVLTHSINAESMVLRFPAQSKPSESTPWHIMI